MHFAIASASSWIPIPPVTRPIEGNVYVKSNRMTRRTPGLARWRLPLKPIDQACVACAYEARSYARARLVGGAYDRVRRAAGAGLYFQIQAGFLPFPENCLHQL